jgi:hypothetical protein
MCSSIPIHPLLALIEQYEEAIEYGEEHAAECQMEYRSECALFGDAGPGMALRVRHAYEGVADMKRAVRSMRRRARKLGLLDRPAKPGPAAADDWAGDIPF